MTKKDKIYWYYSKKDLQYYPKYFIDTASWYIYYKERNPVIANLIDLLSCSIHSRVGTIEILNNSEIK